MEYTGVLVVVALLVGGLLASGTAERVYDACLTAVCRVIGGECEADATLADAPPEGAGGAAPRTVPLAYSRRQPDPGEGGPQTGPRPPVQPPRCESDPDVPWTEGLHSHNDYENGEALQDALDHGATSVEVDVYLDENGNVVVKHLPGEDPRGNLTDLYVDPLNERVRRNGGQVYPGRDAPFQVLLEIKEPPRDTDGDGVTQYEEAYQRAMAELEGLPPGTRVVVDYPGDGFTGYGQQPDNVYFTITPRQIEDDPATEENERGCAIPARLDPDSPEYDAAYAENFLILNGSYDSCADSNGDGEIDAYEQAKLNRFVAEAHAAGYEVRIVAGPDGTEREGGDDYGDFRTCWFWQRDCRRDAQQDWWESAREAGIDYVDTQHLTAGRNFLRDCD